MSGGRVIWQRAPAARSGPTVQQFLQLSGHTAGEGCVDPWVGAGVQTGKKHYDGKGHSLVWSVWIPRCPKLNGKERGPADCVDQNDNEGHSHRLGHGFSDAWRRGGRWVRLDVVKGASG